MLLIGEKINGTRKAVQKAILSRNTEAIIALVKEQTEAGADYLDVNAGTGPDRELEDILWLLDIVQSYAPDIPVCIDSSSAATLKAALPHVGKTPMINSINADSARLEAFIPLVKEYAASVIALALDESKSGMPKNNEERMENIDRILEATRKAEIPDSDVYIDPLIMAVSTDNNAGSTVLACIREIRQKYPETHITGGLSNISFGLPERAIVNRTFLTLAMAAGMDSAVCNPANRSFIEAMKATDMILGNDRFCRKYTTAAKKGFCKK
ncbi:MAG: dihydropteroate synthase [Lachnospiraceae bacterium]|nr:dihydropteroate synthase [Lachnospiraceae bacterium]